MGNIDEFHDAHDQAKTKGYQPVERSNRYSNQDRLDDRVHSVYFTFPAAPFQDRPL